MIQTGVLNLTANRWAPFSYAIDCTGYESQFAGAAFAMQVRASKDRTDSPLITANVSWSSPNIVISIDEATIDSIAKSNPAGGDLVLFYDLIVTPTGGVKARYGEGTFTIKAGVTHG